MVELMEHVAGNVMEPEPLLGAARLQQQQAIAVMRPIEGGHVAVQIVDSQIAPLPAARLPDQRPLEATLVRGPSQPGLAVRRRATSKRTWADTGAFPVPQLADSLSGERVERQQTGSPRTSAQARLAASWVPRLVLSSCPALHTRT